MTNYRGEQRVADMRLIYDREWSQANTLNSGISFRHLLSNETFGNMRVDKEENVPGVFVENTYKRDKQFSLITGIRADYFQAHDRRPQRHRECGLGATGWPTATLRIHAAGQHRFQR